MIPKLLLVDDHSIVRSGLKTAIKDFLPHADIEEAENGESALKKTRNNDYDLVVMDVNMPNTDSLTTLQTILAFKPQIKIIMFSMNPEEVFAKRYLNFGAMGYLSKQASNEEIESAILTVLNNKRYVSAQLNERLLSSLKFNSKSANPFDNLSPREFEIVQHLTNGDSVAKISQELNLHTSTIGTHKARIFEKLQCNNVVDLINLARIHKIIMYS